MLYRFVTLSILCIFLSGGWCLAAPSVIDEFDYPTAEKAQAVWKAGRNSQPVSVSDKGAWGEQHVVTLPLRFKADTDRDYWDREVQLDLSTTANFSLRLFISDPTIVSRFTLYFLSPNGWAGCNQNIEESGWQTVECSKGNFWAESGEFDWSSVRMIRLAAWKEKEGESLIAVDRLLGHTPPVIIVRGGGALGSANAYHSARTVAATESILKGSGVSCGIVSDGDVELGGLKGSSVALFPYNLDMSAKEQAQIVEFVHQGGKVIHFYELPAGLADILGFREKGWTREEYPGQFSACRFLDSVIKGLPEKMPQHSGNIRAFEPKTPDAKVIAYWEDGSGRRTDYPAWLAAPNGALMSHILLNEDKDATRQVVLAMVGHYYPKAWQEAAAGMLEQIGRVGEFTDYDTLTRFIRSGGKKGLAVDLQEVERLKKLAEDKLSAGAYREGFDAAMKARQALVDAYVLCQEPKPGEFRAIWEHYGLGAYPGNWDKSAVHLKEAGFGHIITNMMTSGYASYASEYLSHSGDVKTYGDQIKACVEAAHKHSLKVHVWKVNFNMGGHVSPEWVRKMRDEGRTQADVDGNPKDWLCPSYPENFKLEKDVMLEVVRNYDVDGIHFDYIRYPDGKHCYCDGCRKRFEKQHALKVESWPADCYGTGKLAQQYRDWRCEQITRLVAAVSAESRKIKPEVQISAAVFSRYPSSRDQVGQDWVKWVREGYLDFVCPMDYTESLADFRNMVSEQLGLIKGRIPLYPGISVSSENLSIDGAIAQIRAARDLGADGFTIFAYDKASDSQVFPRLGEGITKRR